MEYTHLRSVYSQTAKVFTKSLLKTLLGKHIYKIGTDAILSVPKIKNVQFYIYACTL